MGMCVHITEWVGSPRVMVCMALLGLVNRIEKGKKRDESLIIKETRVHFSAPGGLNCRVGNAVHPLLGNCQVSGPRA